MLDNLLKERSMIRKARKYSCEIDIKNQNNSQAILLRQIRPCSDVLEFGPGPGSMTEYMKQELGCRVDIVERDSDFVDAAGVWACTAILADIDALQWCGEIAGKQYDYILFADVLEHLLDPQKVVERAKSFLRTNGKILISVPNVAHSSVILGLLENKFPRSESGLLDRTHLQFFTYESAKDLIESAGLHIHEEMATHQRNSNTLVGKSLEYPILEQIVAAKKDADVFQYIFIAGSRSAAQPIHFEHAQSSLFDQCKRHARAELYWDNGKGFSRENSIAAVLGDSNVISFDMTGLQGLVRLRFDPCEMPCSISFTKAVLVFCDGHEVALSIASHNGTVDGRRIDFDTEDPSLFFMVPDEGRDPAKVVIAIEFLSIDHADCLKPCNGSLITPERVLLAEYAHLKEQEIRHRKRRREMAASAEYAQKLHSEYRWVVKTAEVLKNFRISRNILNRASSKYYFKLGLKIILVLVTIPFWPFLAVLFLWQALRRLPRLFKPLVTGLSWILSIAVSPKKLKLEMKYPRLTFPVGLAEVDVLEKKLKPLSTSKEPCDGTLRLNFLFPLLDPDIAFGGYIAAFHFIKVLKKMGCSIRLIVCGDAVMTRKKFLQRWAGNAKFYETFSDCEFFNRNHGPLSIKENDRFVAYSAWEGILANQLTSHTNFDRFIFFLQEYEAIFHPNDSIRAIVEDAYTLPHIPIFNTSTLRDYFNLEGLGVFAPDFEGKKDSFVFEHAVAAFAPPALEELISRPVRKLLFYARPERHAARNLYSLGILGLRLAIERGVFKGIWEFYGIGTLTDVYEIKLARGHTLKIFPRVPQDEYESFIKGFDVGLSLMMAPHPSVLPFEMASAGMVVVTNKSKYRDDLYFSKISKNILASSLSVSGIADGLAQAVEKSLNMEDRIQGAHVACNHSWENAFSPEFVNEFMETLKVV